MKRILKILLIITVLVGSLAGCRQATKDAAPSCFFEWTDSYGREIVLEKAPQRIASLSPAITEIFYMIGAENKLVGVSDFCHYPPEVEKIPKIGGMQNINMEALLAQHPDVLLIGSMVSEKDVETIEKMNIPVVTIKEESNIEGMSEMIEVLGRITGCEQKASEEATRWRQRIEQLKQENENLKGSEKSVFYVVGFGDAGPVQVRPRHHHHPVGGLRRLQVAIPLHAAQSSQGGTRLSHRERLDRCGLHPESASHRVHTAEGPGTRFLIF